MSKDTVTRTFSIGAISGNRSTDDPFTARRHSSAGIRALLWATGSTKSLGSSCGSDSQTNIFPNILTPDNIPQFTIPKLSVLGSSRSVNKAKEDESGFGISQASSGSLASSGSSSDASASASSTVLCDRKAERCVSDPLMQRRSVLHREGSYPFRQSQYSLDPASQAALSLPHLAKVTTPYGFITLSQSPQMADEEALLCQAGPRCSTRDEETAGKATGRRAVDTKDMNPSQSQKLSKDSADSQTKGPLVTSGAKAASTSSSNTTDPATQLNSKPQRRFYHMIKKHLTNKRFV